VVDDNELEVDLGGGTKVTALRHTITDVRVRASGRQPERQEITAFEAEPERSAQLTRHDALLFALKTFSIWLNVAFGLLLRYEHAQIRADPCRAGSKKMLTLALDLQGGSHTSCVPQARQID
jgi:hypothetical protein